MIIVRTSGGLGNQMFQYAFGRALALKQNEKMLLIKPNNKEKTPRKFLLEHFNIQADIEQKKRYFRNPFQKILSGNRQSENYFKDIEKEIRADFTLKEKLSENAEKIKNEIEKSHSVAIHVRRGDYASNPKTRAKHGLCSPDYYAKAVAYISTRVPSAKFFVFSDDIEWVKKNIPLPLSTTYVSGSNISECEELVLMSMCKHDIIANSTFSWWGAWLNQNKEKIVIAPKIWFASGIDENNLIPESWIRL